MGRCWQHHSYSKLERPGAREGPILPETEEIQVSKFTLNSEQCAKWFSAQKKRTDCCKINYLSRVWWEKRKNPTALKFGSKTSSSKVESVKFSFCSVIC